MATRAETCPLPDLGPKVYAAWRASGIGAITEQLQRRLVLWLLGDVKGRTILDLGCGDGDLAVELRRQGAIVTGIDASPEMIQAAKARAQREGVEVKFQVGSAEAIPFAAEQFDAVVAVTILCFVADAGPVFREIARVLRPRGQLVIGELGKWSLWAAARRVRAWLGSALWRRGRFRTPTELKQLAEEAGMTAGAVRGAIYYPRWERAARIMAPYDTTLSRMTTLGTAFLALSATKIPIRATSSGRD